MLKRNWRYSMRSLFVGHRFEARIAISCRSARSSPRVLLNNQQFRAYLAALRITVKSLSATSR
jgi:hypothetical protein